MTMGQFVTTYRKDYLWPYVKTLGLKPETDYNTYQKPTNAHEHNCRCHYLPKPRPTNEQVVFLGPEAYEEDQWTRSGPIGPLMEPKIFLAKVAAVPESHVSRYNQPNVFLKKLQEKYPFIYECLRTAPPDDILSRINRDRLATTYQVDYDNKKEYPSAPYDALIRAAGVEGHSPCPDSVRLSGDVYQPGLRNNISNRVGGGKAITGIPKSEDGKHLGNACKLGFYFTVGLTEYQDTVSRLGNLIIRDGLHDPTRKRALYSRRK